MTEAGQRLVAAGVEGGASDVVLLMTNAFGSATPRYELFAVLRDPLPAEVADRFEAFVAARMRRQPVSQIIGGQHFWKHRFIVTPDTLDPRPETETLVAAALHRPFRRLLDLGTGTGAIAVSLLDERPGATGVATDLSEAALAVAARNADAIGVADRLDLRRADWFDGISGTFDLIVSNPPYITAAEMADLSPEVRDWEPHMALTPGGDGLDAYRAIAAGAPAHLAPGGTLMVEIGMAQGPDVVRIFSVAGLEDVTIHPDMDGRDRVVSARRA
ncbi:peptide chain release factor N(5)-glutamine methyltransferase [Pseudooceanicola sp. LIPI14-2-Ac024]|uniref:peptide chain release factor N(5)-glutamine methyltransferase n=1 Tax=Pseudooceanicola sp. LIPI14-2-Ac024 TaxID=3344875 RepID=UPI0035CF5BC9